MFAVNHKQISSGTRKSPTTTANESRQSHDDTVMLYRVLKLAHSELIRQICRNPSLLLFCDAPFGARTEEGVE